MSYRPASRSRLAFPAAFATSILALGLSFAGIGCGGGIAAPVETDTPSPVPTSTPASATLFAHFADLPTALLVGDDYVYVATKTSQISGVRTQNGALWAVAKATGTRSQLFLDRVGAAPVALARSGAEIVVAMSDGRVLAMPERGGDSRLVAEVPGTPTALVATASDAVLRIAGDVSLLVTVGLGDGAVRTRYVPDAQLVSLAAEGDTVYVGMKTSRGGRVVRLAQGASGSANATEERTIELETAPCGMAAASAGLVVSDGTRTLRYWDGAGVPTAFDSDFPSTCTLALSQDRVFWAGTSPKLRANRADTGGTVLLSRMITPGGTRDVATRAAADWITTELDVITQAASDDANVYVLTSEDIVRMARPGANR